MIKKKTENPALKSLNDVEIFSAGTWNGDDYNEADLDEIVYAFNDTNQHFQPYIKIGHGEEQGLLSKEELPAAGYISKLKRVGKKLMADIVDIPEKIYFLMKNKAYKSRSSEIFWDIDFNGQKYGRMLKAVALLGADMPAVSTLDDIINFYGLDPKKTRDDKNSSVILKICSFDETPKKDDDMSRELENKVKELEDAAALKAKEYSAKEAEAKKAQEKLDSIEKKYAALKEKQKEVEEQAKKDALKSYAKDLVSEKLATPGMKPYIEAMFSPEAKEYSVSHTVKKEGEDEEKLEKKFSNKKEILKEILKLYKEAAKVNFDENSDDVEPEKGNKEDLLNKKIEKYASANEVTYAEAYKVVMKDETEEVDEE